MTDSSSHMVRLLGAGLALLVVGCTSTEPGPPAQLTDLPRSLTGEEQLVSQASNQFALSLFRRLSDQAPNDNVFVSPLSVSFSLGMAMNGATGETLDQMRATLGFGAEELAAINAGYRGLFALESGLDPTTTFDIANSVWHRQGIPIHQSFTDVLRESFEADVRESPFDASTITQVNNWVKDNTGGKITRILDEISPDDVMFLINAIYFKGSWRDAFQRGRTSDGPFTTISGTQQTVPMMRRDEGEGKLRYGFREGTTVGELSYGNGAFVMTVLVPEAFSFDGQPPKTVNDVAAALDTTGWRSYVASMTEIEGEVMLPRFKVEYERELADDLKAMGMVVPFDEVAADFSGMSPLGGDMYISFVKHKAFVEVNEEGTVAAAVTNTGIGLTSLPPGLRVTRPFIFAIRERFSGTILFMGKIVRIP